MQVEILVEPAAPRVGDLVTFTAKIADDGGEAWMVEGSLGNAPVPLDFGRARCDDQCRDPHGPWTPPTQETIFSTDTIQNTYDEPGTYDISIHVANYQRYANGPSNPYGSEETTSFKLTVAPAGDSAAS